jgi:SAM-dependent methyltransferase
MGVREKLKELRWRVAGHYRRELPSAFTKPLVGKRGLEIGGPSRLFCADGLLPVYPLVAGVDGVQWSAETLWHTLDRSEGYAPDGTRRGELHVIDSIDLDPLAEDTYDAVLSSHVIEHLANPLRALAAWRRVTRPGGHLLLVAPHIQGTFDHRRPVTTLEHVVEDFEQGVDEDDMTHLDETLRLHDRARDVAMDDDEWEWMRRENPNTRTLHHHTFTTPSLLGMLDHAGLELLAAETRFPHDIYVLGRWPSSGEHVDNRAFLVMPRHSPFSTDRLTLFDSCFGVPRSVPPSACVER